MAQAQLRNTAGGVVSTVDLNETIFGVERNDTLIHQAVLRIQANRRARHARYQDARRGQRYDGQVVPPERHGPRPARRADGPAVPQGRCGLRTPPAVLRQAMPQKMRRKALCSVLSDKLAEGRIHVVDGFSFAAPRTKDMVAVLQALGLDRKILIVLPAPDVNVSRSARNIPDVRTTVAHTLNVLDAIDSDHLVFTQAALRTLEGC